MSSVETMLVGPDKVEIEDDRLVIHAARAMDWPVREFSRVPIYFRDRKYYLRSKATDEPPYAIRYELRAWPAEHVSSSTRAIIYDEAYVAERDTAFKRQRRNQLAHLVLLPLYPFLGLCWSSFKLRFLGPIGFEPSSLTKASVLLLFNICVAEGIFVGWLRGGLIMLAMGNAGFLWADWAMLLVLSADVILRYSGLLKAETEYHLGFCEWLWPRSARLS